MIRAVPVIIGTGAIAEAHVQSLRSIGLSPAAVWSPNPGRRKRFAETWGIHEAQGLNEAIASEGATHAHVCSVPMRHIEAIRAAARAGLTVITEKPLAPTFELAMGALDEVTRAGVPGWINFHRRMEPGIQRMREVIGAGEIGKPVLITGSYRQQWNAPPSTNDWRFDPESVGPMRTVTEIGSHWLDLAVFVLGDPVSAVTAVEGKAGPRVYDTGHEQGVVDPPNEDAFAALLRFESGTVGQVHASQISHGSFDDIELRVDGSAGSVTWTSAHPALLRISEKLRGASVVGIDTPTTAVLDSLTSAYCRYPAAVGVADFRDGVHNAAVLDAIDHSVAAGDWTSVRALRSDIHAGG